MPSATIVLLVVLGLLVVVLVGTAAVLARSLGRTTRALSVLGERLEHAEERLGRLRTEVAAVADDVVDVAAAMGHRARSLDATDATEATDADSTAEVPTHHG